MKSKKFFSNLLLLSFAFLSSCASQSAPKSQLETHESTQQLITQAISTVESQPIIQSMSPQESQVLKTVTSTVASAEMSMRNSSDDWREKSGVSETAESSNQISEGSAVFDVLLLDDEQLMTYFLQSLPDLKLQVENQGLALLVDGWIEIPDIGYARNIHLGTNHEGQFVRERYYVVSQTGIIYYLDILTNSWVLVYSP